MPLIQTQNYFDQQKEEKKYVEKYFFLILMFILKSHILV